VTTNTEQSASGKLRRVASRLPWLILLVLALAAFLRLFELGTNSLWLDEVYQVDVSSHSWGAIIRSCIYSDTHPPLYYLLQHLWIILFGQSEAAVRSLSACLGILSVLVLYYLGRELFNRTVGLIASLFLAISWFAIYFSQEARPYSLLLALTLLSFLFFVKALKSEKTRIRYVALYAFASILLCYTHLYGLFVIATQALFLFLYRRSYAKGKAALWYALAITVLSFGPWIYVLATKTSQTGIAGLSWLPMPSAGLVGDTLLKLIGTYPTSIVLLLLFLPLCVIGMSYPRKYPGQRRFEGISQTLRDMDVHISVVQPGTALLLLWFFVPLVLSLFISWAITPIFWSRYLIGILPALYLLAACGINNLYSTARVYTSRPGLVPGVFLALVVIVTIPGLYGYYSSPQKEQWRDVAALVQQESTPADAIVVYPDGYAGPFTHYYKSGPQAIVSSAEVMSGNSTVFDGEKRLWLVLMTYQSTADAPIKQYLFTAYGNSSLALERDFKFINVYLFDPQLSSKPGSTP